jgi:hypothetical protein
MKRPSHPGLARHQQGAATLIVVMILFFIMSLVAAYTNRSLIFEQRTSANQYRSSQALEVAEAGLEWAISQLNFGRIDDSCVKSTSTADTSFRQRYLNIDGTTGKITPDPNPNLAAGVLTAMCVWNGAGWTCSCPSTGLPSVTAPTAPGIWPAFRVRLRSLVATGTPPAPPQPSTIWVDVVGCTRLGLGATDPCLGFTSLGDLSEGRALVSSMVSLAGNAAGLPQAAVTSKGAMNLGTSAMSVYNTVSGGSGITLQSGGTIAPSTLDVHSAPGSPAAASIHQNDPALVLTTATPFSPADRMFAAVFRSGPLTFQNQQAAVELTCPTSGCSAASVRTALSFNPGRPLWLTGSLIVDTSGDIGSASEPAVIVINGDLQHTVSGVNLFGLVYLRMAGAATDWNVSGSGQITGAVVTDGGLTSTVTAGPTVVYDPDVLRLVRFNVGTFVRVPGSWRDFR